MTNSQIPMREFMVESNAACGTSGGCVGHCVIGHWSFRREPEQVVRIDPRSVQADAPVEVRSGGPAGAPDATDRLPLDHLLSGPDQALLEVEIHRVQPLAMI